MVLATITLAIILGSIVYFFMRGGTPQQFVVGDLNIVKNDTHATSQNTINNSVELNYGNASASNITNATNLTADIQTIIVEIEKSQCLDSDGGKYSEILGHITFRKYDDYGNFLYAGDAYDKCVRYDANGNRSDKTVMEYYCDDNEEGQYVLMTCAKPCESGFCPTS